MHNLTWHDYSSMIEGESHGILLLSLIFIIGIGKVNFEVVIQPSISFIILLRILQMK